MSDHGVCNNGEWDGQRTLPTFVQHLRRAGYRNAAIGKMHLYPFPEDVASGNSIMEAYGFDECNEIVGKYGMPGTRCNYTDYLESYGLLKKYCRYVSSLEPMNRADHGHEHWFEAEPPLDAERHVDSWVGRQAADWLMRYDRPEPFFLWVGFPGPHDPWDAPTEYVNRYQETDIPIGPLDLPDIDAAGPLGQLLLDALEYGSSDSVNADVVRSVRRRYFAAATLIDDAVGVIVDAVKASGMESNTWIVFSSDHGEMLGDHRLFTKHVFYEPSVRVPLIMRPPVGGVRPTGTGLVEQIDLTASILDIAGAQQLPNSCGRSLVGGANLTGRALVRSEVEEFEMVRSSQYKIVTHRPSGTVGQVFDLGVDPSESDNLAGSSRADAAIAEVARLQLEV